MTLGIKLGLCAVLLFSVRLAAAEVGPGEVVATRPAQEARIFDQSDIVLKPYLWFYRDAGTGPDPFQSVLDEGNPFTVTSKLIQEYRSDRDPIAVQKNIARVVDEWRLDRKAKLTYKQGHGKLPPGWWSGMDLAAFPLLLVGLWQDTQDEATLALARRMLDIATQPVAEGGIVWRNGEGCWFSEYAWDGMSAEEEYFVLNGHLHALQSLLMLSRALGDEALARLYSCGLVGTKAYADRFLKAGDPWAQYMLTPTTINQTHYVIFEMMQFDALYELTGETFYQEQAKLRRALLQRYFPLQLHMGTTNKDRSLFLSAIGAPHPYSVDTYPLDVLCKKDGVTLFEGSIRNPSNTARNIAGHAFLYKRAPGVDVATRCQVTSNYAGQTQLLYEATPEPTASVRLAASLVGGVKAETFYDVVDMPRPMSFVIDPKRRVSIAPASSYMDDEARVVLKFTRRKLTPQGLVAVVINPEQDLPFQVMLGDGDKSVSRYYPKLLAGKKNIVILSLVGIDGGTDLKALDSLTFRFSTSGKSERFKANFGALYVFPNQYALYQYLKTDASLIITE